MSVPPQANIPSVGAAYLCLALSMSLVGLYVGLSPMLVAVFPAMLLAWLRFATAALAMLPWLRPGPTDAPLSRHDHGLLFMQSFLGNFLFTLMALHGTALAGATSAGVVMAGIPACVALMSRLFLKEPLSGRIWWAAACTATAVALLALQREEPTSPLSGLQPGSAAEGLASDRALGHLLLLGAVVCEASYVVIGKRLSARLRPERLTAIINLWGLALSTPLGLALALAFDFRAVSWSIWALLVFYALAASMITVWLWMKGMQRVPAQKAGIFTVFLPLSSAAVGVGFLGEPWGIAHAAALLLAVLAVGMVTRPERVAHEARPAEREGPGQTPRPPDGT